VNGARTSKRVALAYRNNKIFMVWCGANLNTIWQCSYSPTASTQVVAHKGNLRPWDSGRFPRENTLASIETAIAAGVSGVEFDVQQAQDGLIVHHNKSVDNFVFTAHSVEEIQERYPYLATLDEALDLNWGNTVAHIELKNVNDPLAIATLASEKLGENFVINSFEERYLQDLLSNTDVNLGLLTNSVPNNINETVKHYPPDRVSILVKYDASGIRTGTKTLVDKGYKIGLWTIDYDEELDSRLLDGLVSWIITNDSYKTLRRQNWFYATETTT
jgi:glycerophosphoryl diester phosphodiesterase